MGMKITPGLLAVLFRHGLNWTLLCNPTSQLMSDSNASEMHFLTCTSTE